VTHPTRAGKAGEHSALHDALVEQLKGMGCIQSPGVEDAFRAVPRHLFLPGVELERVYSDDAILTKRLEGEVVSSSAQPPMKGCTSEHICPRLTTSLHRTRLSSTRNGRSSSFIGAEPLLAQEPA
jgi:hypothetical protein